MKKIIILIVTFISPNSNAFEDLQSTPPVLALEQQSTFLDANSEDFASMYTPREDLLPNIDEYDQNVTDNVTSPTISSTEAFIREFLGALLVRYINVRETARIYYKEIKDMFMQWYHSIIK